MSKRSSRNKNTISPFDRIVTCRGIEFIKDTFYGALNKAQTMELLIPLSRFKSVQNDKFQTTGPVDTEPIKVQCKVKTGESSSYPSVKVRLSSKEDLAKLCGSYGEEQKSFDQSSVPLDLHRLAALSKLDWNITQFAESPAIHRCHNKRCFDPEHLYFGTNDTNMSTEFCPVYILVNGILVNCCCHNPVCLVPGNRVPTTI